MAELRAAPVAETRPALLAFTAGARRFGIATGQVREVGLVPRLTRVPQAPDSLLGIGNVRGEAVAVVSLASLLGLPAQPARQMILLAGEPPAALAIDRIEGVVAGGDCETPDYAALIAAAYPAKRDAALASRTANKSSGRQAGERLALLAFAIGDQRFALPMTEIEGVLKSPGELARMPHADPAVLGTTVWRNRLLPLFSLGTLLGLEDRADSTGRVIVVRIGSQSVGVLVDRIDGIARPLASQIDAIPPALLRGQDSEAVIRAIVRPDGARGLISLLAAGQLLREDITAKLAATPGAPADDANGESARSEALLLFASAGQRFAMPLAGVHQIARVPSRLTRVPRSPAILRGVISHRGEMLPVVDLGMQLAGAARGDGATESTKARLLIVTIAGTVACLLVEAVAGIRHVAARDITAAPLLGDARTAPVGRVVTLDAGEAATLVLSPDALFGQIEADLVAALAGGSATAA